MADEIKTGSTTETNSGGDPTQAVKGGANLPEKAVSTSEPEQTAKTFTQAELDAIVKQRLERQAKGQPSKEEMEAFRKWQDSRKTAEQLSQEKISAAENGRADAEKKLAAAEAKCCAYSKGVTAEAVDDVIALAMAKVSDDMPIEKAIDAVISKYPSFCSAKSAPQGVTTGVSFGNGGKQPSGVEAAFLAKNPNIKI